MNKSLISIIIPTFNRGNLICETLESVIAQTHSNWECFIIDDNSNDNSQKIILDFIKDDDRFRFIEKSVQNKSGASASRNIGLSLSSGSFIQFLDSDDLLANNKLEKQLKLLESFPNINNNVAVCKWEMFNETVQEINNFCERADYKSFENSKKYFELIGKFNGFYPPECFLIPIELIQISGYWNENITLSDDAEFFFRILSNSNNILFCEDTHVFHRKSKTNGDNLSLLNSPQKAQHLINSWKIIESLYIAKFNDFNSDYINKKKSSVYNEIKRAYPIFIKKNKSFFYKEIKSDTIYKSGLKLIRKIKMKIIYVIK